MGTYERLGKIFWKAMPALLLTVGSVPLAIPGQMPTLIPLSSEPHHHLALHNPYVNLYQVEVAPQDQVQLHRHEFDAVSIMMSNAEVTVRAPGKPDASQKLSEGQVRLQPRGYVHSTSIEGDNTYRNVTVELVLPQQGARNLCAAVIASQGLNCSRTELPPGAAPQIDEPLFETNQTRVTLIRVLPQKTRNLGEPSRAVLLIALDALLATQRGETGQRLVRPGDFVWLEKGAPASAFKNLAEKEARLISFTFEH
jgi:quercetin dioxygenase-like cupin family protein